MVRILFLEIASFNFVLNYVNEVILYNRGVYLHFMKFVKLMYFFLLLLN